MDIDLPTYAERIADKANGYSAFGGFSVSATRRELSEMLGRIGSAGFFGEYTKHDISHIDAMLGKVDWVVPESSRQYMTVADWLLIVLSAYFHDLGMLITTDEYKQRQHSDFPRFADESLLTSDDNGRDYASRLKHLKSEDRDRFLYQEFVRNNHAARVRNWIAGNTDNALGMTNQMQDEVQRITAVLDDIFRDDLAKVCESHHLNDLENIARYPVRQFYGQHDQETANVQYAAVILRTIDLLHVTRDRAPSIAFRIINPSDPVSQAEWSKQLAVRAVKPQLGKDEDGSLSETAPRDTISVHARFTDGDGFFGLTSYLSYAETQLRKSHEWIARSNQLEDTKHTFPWRSIDSSNVEAKGFLTQAFGFTLDQAKVLDLLTGHTLYNDPNVVIRELLQNAIDAVRLKHRGDAQEHGLVRVTWDSSSRTLEVLDNGTGMTQAVIENNLLKAGSSLYQEPDFRKKHPDFHPISRFGIGVLSTFMIADEVEIITCHPDEPEARQLSLRSVHGKYLVRLLDKTQDLPNEIKSHGTLVRMKIRPSAEIGDVITIARQWVVIPGCNVEVHTDQSEAASIGFSSVSEALRASILQSTRYSVDDFASEEIKIHEHSRDGLSVAYAVRWDKFFSQYSFLSYSEYSDDGNQSGICVEGIRVETSPPGFQDNGGIWAMANASGPNAPKTNVARSSLEFNTEYQRMLKFAYETYCDHITAEVSSLEHERNCSLTWAVGEAPIIAGSLTGENPKSWQLLDESLKQVPFFIIEVAGKRKKATLSELGEYPVIYVIASAVAEYVEELLRELPSAASRSSLLKALGDQDWQSPSDGAVLCTRIGNNGIIDEFFFSDWQLSAIRGDTGRRRCSFRFTPKGASQCWSPAVFNNPHIESLSLSGVTHFRLTHDLGRIRIPIGDVNVSGFSHPYIGVALGSQNYLFPNHPWAGIINTYRDDLGKLDMDDARLQVAILLIEKFLSYQGNPPAQLAEELHISLRRQKLDDIVDVDEFAAAAMTPGLSFFDARHWIRISESREGF